MTAVLLRTLGYDMETILEMLEGELKEKPLFPNGVTPRHLMRTLGTEWGRDCVYGNLWVDLALIQASRLMEAGKSVVIDDLRFPNEYEAIKDRGGECWSVDRPGKKIETDHPSEGLLDSYPFDKTINNGGSLEDLHRAIAQSVKGE